VTPDSPVRLTVPAEASYLSVCRAALSGMLVDAGDDEVEESKLVLSEVCAAAVARGSADVLEVEFRAAPGAIEIAVTGAGVDAFLTDPVAHEVVDRLTSGWRVERDRTGEGASVTFSRRLR
jgi:anti-sigma regulatory factor (Ser/Thr protein kinase)